MYRWLILLIVVALSAPAGAAEVPWWNRAWKSRKQVRVDVPKFREEPGFEKLRGPASDFGRLTARASILREAPGAEGHPDVRVVDASGKVLPHRVYSFGDKTQFTVVFPAQERTADYHIYYDNPNAKPAEQSDWRPSTAALEIVAAKHHGKPTFELAEVLKGIRGQVDILGVYTTSHIAGALKVPQGSRGPRGRAGGSGLITSIEGYLHCPIAGRYVFSVNYRGASYLFVDGKLVVEARALYPTPHTWPQPNNVMLSPGYHHMRLLLVEAPRSVGLGWQMPGMPDIELVKTGFYAKYINVKTVAFEQLEQPEVVFFTHEIPPEAINLRRPRKLAGPLVNFPGCRLKKPVPVPVAYTKLTNLSTVSDAGDVTWRWKLQRLVSETNPVPAPEPNTFETPERDPAVFLQVGKSYSVTLTASRNGDEFGTYHRLLTLPLPKKAASSGTPNRVFNIIKKPSIRLEVLSAPNIVYAGEENNAAFRVVTNLNHPVPVDWKAWIMRGEKRENEQTGRFFAGTGKDVVMSFPLHLADFPKRQGSMTVSLEVLDTETNRVEFAIVPSPGDFSKLTAPHGFFINPAGQRAVICTTYENEADYRRWMFLKYIARKLDTGPKNIMIFGSTMTNTSPPLLGGQAERPAENGKKAIGYADYLEEMVKGKAAGVTFVPRTGGAAPILSDMIEMSKGLSKNKAQVAIIAPGLEDAELGASREDFARGLDVIIDLLRDQGHYVKIILVTPPPLVSDPELSKLYSLEMHKIAIKHHTEIVNIHKLLFERKNWRDAYRASPDSEVFNLYPNDETQKLIARKIADEM